MTGAANGRGSAIGTASTLPLDAATAVDHPWAASLGIIWRAGGVIGGLVAMSLLWVLALGLVLPLPAVTAAILRVALASARGRSPSVLPELLAGLREGWRRATAVGAAVAAVSLVLGLDLWVAGAMPAPAGPILQAALAVLAGWWLLVNVYLWPLVGGTAMPVRAVFRAAVGLSLLELPAAVLALAATGATLAVLAAAPASVVLVGPGLSAAVWGRVAWRAMRRHLEAGALDGPA